MEHHGQKSLSAVMQEIIKGYSSENIAANKQEWIAVNFGRIRKNESLLEQFRQIVKITVIGYSNKMITGIPLTIGVELLKVKE